MFCPKCGKQIPDNAEFCTGCGAKVTPAGAPAQPQYQYQPRPAGGSGINVNAILSQPNAIIYLAAAVLHLLAVIFWFLPTTQMGMYGFSMSYSVTGLLGLIADMGGTNLVWLGVIITILNICVALASIAMLVLPLIGKSIFPQYQKFVKFSSLWYTLVMIVLYIVLKAESQGYAALSFLGWLVSTIGIGIFAILFLTEKKNSAR